MRGLKIHGSHFRQNLEVTPHNRPNDAMIGNRQKTQNAQK